MMTSETVAIDQVHPEERLRMYQLMDEYYENVSFVDFQADLDKKDCVIILRNNADICGFSTQVIEQMTVLSRDVKILFSGDTVIAKKHRNSLALPLAWGRMILRECRAEPDVPFYWLLSTKGYKTYRYLSVFFREYYPHPDKVLSTFDRQVLEISATYMFNDQLDRNRWIIESSSKSQRLRPGVAEITASRLSNPDIAFFDRLNPGHPNGDELVCLARIDETNLTPYILRKLDTQ